MENCPICSKKFASEQIELHVNSCLDNQESHTKSSPSKSSSQVDDSAEEIEILSVNKPKNAFAALGMKLEAKAKKLLFLSLLQQKVEAW